MRPDIVASPKAEVVAMPGSPVPSQDFRRRRRGFIIAGAVVFALGLMLAFFDYRSTARPEDVVLDLTLPNTVLASPFETPAIAFSAEQLKNRIRLSAPVDNSWMKVEIAVRDQKGKEATRLDASLVYYHGRSAGGWWRKGVKQQTHLLSLPTAGDYRFSLTASEFAGVSKVAVPSQLAKPLHFELMRGQKIGANFRVIGFATLSFLGVALLLRGTAAAAFHPPGLAASLPGASAVREGGRPSAGERMVFLDGLRGIASVGVLVCHLFVPELSAIAASLTAAVPHFVSMLALHGDLGVEVFFVLSGFVIAYSLRHHRIDASLAVRFILRRSLRLDPPYWVALVIGAGVAALGYPDSLRDFFKWTEGLPGLLANGFYLQDILGYPSPVGVAWTLCLEIQFYLAYLALLWAAQSLSRVSPVKLGAAPRESEATCLLVLAGPLFIWSAYRWFPGAIDFSFGGAWFRFFLGALIFWATQVKFMRPVLIITAISLGVASVATGDQRSAMAVGAALLILLANENRRSMRWLAGKVWQHLGRISYSLYLSHVVVGLPFMNWIWHRLPHTTSNAVMMLFVGVGSSLTAAECLHRLVEIPALKLSQRIRYQI